MTTGDILVPVMAVGIGCALYAYAWLMVRGSKRHAERLRREREAQAAE